MGQLAPFKPSLVHGINDAAIDAGLYRWPSEKVGFEICHQLAAQLQGPDVLPDAGLAKQSCYDILVTLKTAADNLATAGHTPSAPEVLRFKQASALSFEDRAGRIAEAYMTKAAAEGGSLTDVGENTPESAAMADQHAKLDLRNRGPAEYLVGVGNTQMLGGGVVGRETPHPKRQGNSPSIANSLTEQSQKAAGARAPAPSAEAHLASLALKSANEDMTAGDLAQGAAPSVDPAAAGAAGAPPAVDPGRVARTMAYIHALKDRFMGPGPAQPGPDAQVAAAGLSGHPEGMQVMAELLNQKTAGAAEDIIQQILTQQGQAGELASPELVEAIHQMMEQEAGGGGGGEAPPPEAAMPPGAEGGMPPGMEAPKTGSMQTMTGVPDGTNTHKNFLMRGAAAIKGALSKKDAPKVEEPHAEEAKVAAQLERLRKLAAGEGGSLTDVGKNTPEGAAVDDQFAKLDQKNRATNKYLEGQGGTTMPDKGQRGVSMPNDAHESPVHTDTVPSRETKNASTKLSAEEQTYVAELTKISEAYGPYLPATLNQAEKIAHVKQLHARAPSERAAYVQALRG